MIKIFVKMNYKKLFLFTVSLFMFHNTFSQIKWEVKAGISSSDIRVENRHGEKASTLPVSGLRLGIGASIPLTDHFFLQPSFVRTKRGFRIDGVSDILWWGADLKVRTSYLELPVDLLYTFPVGTGNLSFAAGPYAGYGTGGRWETSSTVLLGDIIIPGNGEVDFQNDASYRNDRSFVYAKPWDFGLHFKIGYTLFSRYSVSLEMQNGLANLEPPWGDYKPEGSVKNRAWGLLLGYTF